MGRHSSSSRSRTRTRSRTRSRSRFTDNISREEKGDGYRVHVADLGIDCSQKEIEKEFMKFGDTREVWLARNPPCFAFIVYKRREDSEKAIKEMNGKIICGARVRVSCAKPRTRGHNRWDPNMRCYQCGQRGHFSRDCNRISLRDYRTNKYDYDYSDYDDDRSSSRRRSRRRSISLSRSRSRSHSRSTRYSSSSSREERRRQKSKSVSYGRSRSKSRNRSSESRLGRSYTRSRSRDNRQKYKYHSRSRSHSFTKYSSKSSKK